MSSTRNRRTHVETGLESVSNSQKPAERNGVVSCRAEVTNIEPGSPKISSLNDLLSNAHSQEPKAYRSPRNARQRQSHELPEDIKALHEILDRHVIYSISDRSGRIVEVNQGFCQISGYGREELIGQDHHILNSGHHPKSFWVDMWKTIASGEPWRGEVCNRAKDSSLYWVDSTNIPCFNEDGQIHRYVSLRIDITKKKLAEQSSAAAHRQLSSVLDAASQVSIIATSPEGIITTFNQGAERLLGYSAREMIGRKTPAVFHLESEVQDRETQLSMQLGRPVEGFEVFTYEAQTGGHAEREWTYVRKDGAKLTVNLIVTAVQSEDGKLTGYLGIAQDITARKRAEENARSATRILDAQLSAIDRSQGRIEFTSDGIIIDVNPNYEAIVGYRRDDLIGKHHRVFVPEKEYTSREYRQFWKSLSSGEFHSGQYKRLAVDGGCFWIQATYNPVLGADGRVEKIVKYAIDITKRKLAESELIATRERLARQQDRFEHAVSGSSDGLWDFLPHSNQLWCSDQLKQLLGAKITQLDSVSPRADHLIALVHSEDKIPVLKSIIAHVRTNAQLDVECRLKRLDGNYHWFRVKGQSVRDRREEVVRMSGSLTDIHARHLAESENRRLSECLNLALRGSNTGFWDWDLESGKTTFNDVWYTMLGYEPGDLPMTIDSWRQLCHPVDLRKAMRQLEQYFDGKIDAYSVEYRLCCKSGDWRWVRGVGEVVEWGDNGTPQRMVGLHIDIQELKEAVLEAKNANQSKSDFLANMSHEIRTPMTAILGYTDILLTQELKEQQYEMLETINRNGRHLLTVINDILDVSKIEAGKVSLESIPTSPVAVLKDVAALLEVNSRRKGLDLEIRQLSSIPQTILTDPTRLKQILLNLVSNAIKFTEMGTVTVEFYYSPEINMMKFAVSDTGIGMTKKQCDRIAEFKAFAQADSSTTRQFGGTGLGLRISSAFAEMLGGSLAVESIQGSGSNFTLTIDAGVDVSEGMVPPERFSFSRNELRVGTKVEKMRENLTQTEDAPLKGKQILLVEDGVDNQRLISFILRKMGAEVTIAENGEFGFQKAMDGVSSCMPFDIILMDMQMPVMDGYTTVKKLREENFKHPVIALTAHAMDGDRAKCLEAGCDDFVTKPIDKDNLLHILLEAVSKPYNY